MVMRNNLAPRLRVASVRLLHILQGLVLTTSLLLAFSSAHAATSPVGVIPAQFKVTDSGAASYAVPIGIPPGTAGMQPSPSLQYSSQGGNGLLGMGWSLGGLSGIPVAHEPKHKMVRLGALISTVMIASVWMGSA